jgi:hypothetical protein
MTQSHGLGEHSLELSQNSFNLRPSSKINISLHPCLYVYISEVATGEHFPKRKERNSFIERKNQILLVFHQSLRVRKKFSYLENIIWSFSGHFKGSEQLPKKKYFVKNGPGILGKCEACPRWGIKDRV